MKPYETEFLADNSSEAQESDPNIALTCRIVRLMQPDLCQRNSTAILMTKATGQLTNNKPQRLPGVGPHGGGESARECRNKSWERGVLNTYAEISCATWRSSIGMPVVVEG